MMRMVLLGLPLSYSFGLFSPIFFYLTFFWCTWFCKLVRFITFFVFLVHMEQRLSIYYASEDPAYLILQWHLGLASSNHRRRKGGAIWEAQINSTDSSLFWWFLLDWMLLQQRSDVEVVPLGTGNTPEHHQFWGLVHLAVELLHSRDYSDFHAHLTTM